MEQTKTIVRVNNVDIIATSDEQLIAIRPICEALGVDANGQKQRIERDDILGPVACMIHATGRDGKQYEMFCIPLCYVFGWLFSIDTSRVNEEARPAVAAYKKECYDALFRHFSARALFVEEKQKEIDRQLTVVDDAKERFRNAKNVLADVETRLKKLRALTLEDYDLERRQQKFDF